MKPNGPKPASDSSDQDGAPLPPVAVNWKLSLVRMLMRPGLTESGQPSSTAPTQSSSMALPHISYIGVCSPMQ